RHDRPVVERLADPVLVMHHGRVVEEGPTSQVLTAPQDPYTRRLLAAIPSADSRGRRLSDLPPAPVTLGTRADASAERPAALGPLLAAADLGKSYRGPDRRPRAVVDGASFQLPPG